MPQSTQNSQADSKGNNCPFMLVDNSVPVSCVSSCGAAPMSVAINTASQPSPEFLATVVQDVKAALAAEQAPVSCSASPALRNHGQTSLANSSSKAGFGAVPSLLSLQAPAFAVPGAVFAGSSASTGASALQGRPAFVVPTFVSTFFPSSPSLSLFVPNMVILSTLASCPSTFLLPQVSISSTSSFPLLNQSFIIGPGFSLVQQK